MKTYLNITKEQFDEAYNKHLPSKWIIFGFKYFSKKSEKNTFSLNNILITILLAFFTIGFIGTVFNIQKIIAIPTILYTSLLFILVIYLFSVVLLNNSRIKKIAKELNISVEEYNFIVDKF